MSTEAGSIVDKWRTAYVYLNIRDPLIAWLVYRGELVSASQAHSQALSIWLTKRLKDREAYEKEMVLEQLRAVDHPEAVSRINSFYAFPDLKSAQDAAALWRGTHFQPEFLAEIKILPSSSVSKYDSAWYTNNFYSPNTEWIKKYYEGVSTDKPVWELVVDGRAWIMGTELRRAAYETVKAEWPECLALLEMARLGVELESDLGLITAMAVSEDEETMVKYAMNFDDATNQVFLDKVANFKGPKNRSDLNENSELIVPDLSPEYFSLV